MAKFAHVLVVDELPVGVTACRSDRCPVIGLHAEHRIWGGGRPPKACPNCGKNIRANGADRTCSDPTCGWHRTVRPLKEKSR